MLIARVVGGFQLCFSSTMLLAPSVLLYLYNANLYACKAMLYAPASHAFPTPPPSYLCLIKKQRKTRKTEKTNFSSLFLSAFLLKLIPFPLFLFHQHLLTILYIYPLLCRLALYALAVQVEVNVLWSLLMAKS